MKRRINVILLITALLAGTGCATYQAYPGKKRPRTELALLTLSVENPVIDGHAIDRKGFSTTMMIATPPPSPPRF